MSGAGSHRSRHSTGLVRMGRTLMTPDEAGRLARRIVTAWGLDGVTEESLSIRERRMAEGMKQGAAARRAGVSQAFICLVERGERPIPEGLAARIFGEAP